MIVTSAVIRCVDPWDGHHDNVIATLRLGGEPIVRAEGAEDAFCFDFEVGWKAPKGTARIGQSYAVELDLEGASVSAVIRNGPSAIH